MPRALITGASAGIGKEFARLFAADGYDLILVARRQDALQTLADELESQHHIQCHVIGTDLASPHAAVTIETAVRAAGLQVDVLVNNAGFAMNGPFASVPVQTHLDILQVNITSLVHLSRTFLPEMTARGSGGILNVASTAAFVPGPMMAVYYATKAFVLSFSEALANEVAGSGVHISCLCPGATITEFQVRAGMDKTRLFDSTNAFVMDALTVARMGVDGFKRNQTVVICGLTNRLMVAAARVLPRKTAASMVRRLQDVTPQ